MMIKKFTMIATLLIIGCLISFSSCKKTPAKLIIGKWKADEGVLNIIKGGTYDISGTGFSSDNGTYILYDDASEIDLHDNSGYITYYKISKLTKSDLWISEPNIGSTIHSVIYFTKE